LNPGKLLTGTRSRRSTTAATRTVFGWYTAAIVVLCAGCSNVLAPRPDTTRFFILSAVAAGPNVAASGSAAATAVGLGPISFPQYLARNEMVTRTADNRIQFSARNRWAEPLDITFRRVLAEDLSRALGGASVTEFPFFGAAPPFTMRVQVTINRFETDSRGTAHLSALWNVIEVANNRVLYATSSEIEVAGAAGAAARAATLSQAAAQFAYQIAAELVSLERR